MSNAVRTVQLDERLYQSDCSNGLTLVTEHLPGVRSAAAGVWVRQASAQERREQMGISHLLEHMLFKGTTHRSARDLALALESRGGSLNAWTSRDYTALQARILDTDLPLALDVLTDLFRNPLLRESDLTLERNVVLEELRGVKDTPDDLIFEYFSETLWPEHPYGYSILGTPESIAALSVDDLRRRHQEGYYPGNTVIAVAGNVQHEQLLENLDRLGWLSGPARNPLAAAAPPPAHLGVQRVEHSSSRQVHLVLGTETFPDTDRRYWTMAVLDAALGGGMSSRLFQRMREELALCYEVSTWSNLLRGSGDFSVYVSTSPASADQALAAMQHELNLLAQEGLAGSELEYVKGQLRGQFILGMESTSLRMHRLASHILGEEPYRSLEEVLNLVDGVTSEDVAALAASLFAPSRMTSVRLGPGSE